MAYVFDARQKILSFLGKKVAIILKTAFFREIISYAVLFKGLKILK